MMGTWWKSYQCRIADCKLNLAKLIIEFLQIFQTTIYQRSWIISKIYFTLSLLYFLLNILNIYFFLLVVFDKLILLLDISLLLFLILDLFRSRITKGILTFLFYIIYIWQLMAWLILFICFFYYFLILLFFKKFIFLLNLLKFLIKIKI